MRVGDSVSFTGRILLQSLYRWLFAGSILQQASMADEGVLSRPFIKAQEK